LLERAFFLRLRKKVVVRKKQGVPFYTGYLGDLALFKQNTCKKPSFNEGRVVLVDADLVVRIVLGEVAFDYSAWEARGLAEQSKGAHDGNSEPRKKMWIAI